MARRYAMLVFLTFAMALLSSMMSFESKATNAPAAPIIER